MVKKLFKHEIHALWRLMAPVWGILLGVSVLGRLIQLFEQNTVIYDIISGSSVLFYVVALLACFVCPFVFVIVRFYRNLFSGEGYLTFTLPVTTGQHLWVKLTVAVVTELLTLFAAAVSVILVTFGDLTIEISKAIAYLYKMCVQAWGAHLPMYTVEVILAIIALFTTETLLYYACIAIGQQAKKNRILCAVGAYFGFYVIKQVLGTIVVIIVSFIDWEPLLIWITEHPFATIHTAFCGGIVIEALLGAFFFVISYLLMSRRLNLE